ncbi:DNA replication and repair protein RecF [termite gut metagenome]|uniref:DNA replication and repair protein RecF n=1 Tax=termite gut metagenome TaxID=433724 RepID=A0A5J4QYT4_9ZZZZ
MEEKGLKIKSISVKSYKCLDEVEIDCKRNDTSIYQWTVLLGNNNTGKTSLLKAIANLRPIKLKYLKPEDYVKEDDFFVPAAHHHFEFALNELAESSQISCVIRDVREGCEWNWRYETEYLFGNEDPKMNDFHIYAYGVSRYPTKTSLSEFACGDCDSLFYPYKYLVDIEEWLMQLDYAAKKEKKAAAHRLTKIKELICGNLFPEIDDFKFETSDTLHNSVLFRTKDGWFPYTQLGYGYQSMLSWVIDLCKRMFERYPDSENPLSESAIVLVDEIDLHLHPKWQRDIISFLSKAFPNVQFIVTTHSPLVIQSMDNVNLYVLHREGNKVKVEHSSVSNFRGWTVEEILRDTMRLESDIHSNEYQQSIQKFDEGLDQNDKIKVIEAYKELCEILHPENPVRRLLELQLPNLDN